MYRPPPAGPTLRKTTRGAKQSAAAVLAPGNGQSYETYIHDALVDELKLAGVYSDQAGKSIQIKLTKIDFSSGLTDAQWTIVADVSVGSDPAVTVTEVYPFSSSFFGGVACNDTAGAFLPAVQDLLNKILTNDQLKASLAKP
jgi:hypothetical protein